MPKSTHEMIELLAQAEAKASALQTQNDQLVQAFDDMLKAQEQEALQLAEVSEQLWAVQDALAAASADKDQALALLASLSGKLDSIQRQVQDTQQAAREGVTSLEIEARLYEIKSTTEDERLNAMLEAYNESLQEPQD